MGHLRGEARYDKTALALVKLETVHCGFTVFLRTFREKFTIETFLGARCSRPWFPALPTGNMTEARRVLEAIERNVPGLAVVRLRRVALERRAGQLDQSEALLQEAVADSKEKPTLHAFYSIKLARLLLKLGRDPSKARRVLQEALEISPVRLRLNIFAALDHRHVVSQTDVTSPLVVNPLFFLCLE